MLIQVLKGKYFHDCSFMETGEKSRSSHGWSSIMAGKTVLEKGMGYIVGNGENIKVWSDQWLSPLHPIAPMGPPTFSNQHLKVSDLLDHQTNEWNLDQIRLHLPHYEDLIRLIIPSSLKPCDKKAWLGDPSGVYSSKSGYKKIFEDKNIPHPEPFGWMQLVWKLHISPKLHHFLWRLLNRPFQ